MTVSIYCGEFYWHSCLMDIDPSGMYTDQCLVSGCEGLSFTLFCFEVSIRYMCLLISDAA